MLFPFFLAVFLSFVLAPLEDYLTRLKIPRAIAIIFILILTFLILYLLASLIYTTGKAFAAELPKYSQKVSTLLTSIQEKYGIIVDGIVGPMTKIVLYNEKGSLKIPHIMHKGPTQTADAENP